MLETYLKGKIEYNLFLGTSDRLGKRIELSAHEETAELEDELILKIDELLVEYVPNVLPNRLDRGSPLGRSDLLGLEGLMDGLDEVYSAWVREIILARHKILVPEQYLDKMGKSKYNLDADIFVKLDVDPTVEGNNITTTSFDIRSDKYEQTALNLLERIVSGAGYSPQSFGLKIEGRAESGTALQLRERKSFATKAKKENYWQVALERFTKKLVHLYVSHLGGMMDADVDITIEFADSISHDLGQVATSVKMLSDAQAMSTDTKVRMIHPEWDDEQIEAEVAKIIDENKVAPPVENPDLFQLDGDDEDADQNRA